MVQGCNSFGALLRITGTMINRWFELGLLEVIRNFALDLVFASLAAARIVEVYINANSDQGWHPYVEKDASIGRIWS